MSFKCDECGKTTAEGVGCHKVVVETRNKIYIERSKDKNGFEKESRNYGTEIVKEQNLCPTCYSKRI